MATDFTVTISLLAADATAHLLENPFCPAFLRDAPAPVTLALVGLLGAVFLKGFKEAVGIAVALVAMYLAMNAVVVGVSMYEVATHPRAFADWRQNLWLEHGSAIAMIAQTAGKNYAVVEAMLQKYREELDKLLADYPSPSHAERMAAPRVANNWMAVHILESRMMLQNPTGASAMLLERRVTLADKRLHASLKSLAVLRRPRKPPAPKRQVNIANVGPMVVSNG